MNELIHILRKNIHQLSIPVVIYIMTFIIMFVPGMWQFGALLLFYMVLGQAFNMFLGLTGYVDFGYVAFMALGAYGMVLAIDLLAELQLGVSIIFLGFILGGLMSVLLSSAVGGIALRLRGAYFAIATIGVNEGFRYLIEGTNLWGGSLGIIVYKDMMMAFGRSGATFLSTVIADIMVLIVGILSIFLMVYMVNSKIGYALRALREDEDVAKVIGINTTKYKIIAFITSAFLAGLLGAAAWGLKLTHVYPEETFNIIYTIEAIVIVMLGGSGTLLGPIIGGMVYGALKYYLSTFLPGFQLLIFAPILIAIVTAFPHGIIGWATIRLKGTPLEKYIV